MDVGQEVLGNVAAALVAQSNSWMNIAPTNNPNRPEGSAIATCQPLKLFFHTGNIADEALDWTRNDRSNRREQALQPLTNPA
jgi:hypothetical protein